MRTNRANFHHSGRIGFTLSILALYCVCRDPFSQTSSTAAHGRAEGVDMDGLIRSLIKCVRRRLREDDDVTVEAVAREIGFTRQYVSGRFHRSTGRLLSDFLKEKKLEKAAKLLKRGNLRITEVARRCGFDSENYFRQQFRHRFGMSPRQFRRNGTFRRARPQRSAAVAAMA